VNDVLRAARVAKDIRVYEAVAWSTAPDAGHALPIQLTEREKKALRDEKDLVFSEKGMWIVVLTVSLAAFLQGFVQSSFNSANLFSYLWIKDQIVMDNQFGVTNAIPYLTAALL
jgi:hypothetical protein